MAEKSFINTVSQYIAQNPTIVTGFLSALAATISAASAAITVSNARKKLRCNVAKKATQLQTIYAVDENKKIKEDPFGMPFTHIIELTMINPSTLPMSYFDLEVTAKDGTDLIFPIKRWSEAHNYRTVGFTRLGPIASLYPGRLMMPDDIYGVVGSNSHLPLMLAINAHGFAKVRVSFKICKRALFKNKHHSKPERYKTYHYTVTTPWAGEA